MIDTALIVYQEDILEQAARTLGYEVSGQSVRAYAGDTRVFKAWLDAQGMDIAQVDYDAVVRYHAYLLSTYAKATAARRFVVMRRLLEVAVKRGLLPHNPAADVKSKIRIDDASPHTALTKREAKRLLAAIDTTKAKGRRDYALVMLLIYGGIRRSECAAIRLADITLKQEHHVLTIQNGKGNKRRDVPLRPDTFRAINAYLAAVDRLNDSPDSFLFTGFVNQGQKQTMRGITDRQIANIVKEYAALAHLTCTPHDLRATSITLMIDTGAPIIKVQRLVGHSSPVTTERYYSRKLDLDDSPVYKIDLNS